VEYQEVRANLALYASDYTRWFTDRLQAVVTTVSARRGCLACLLKRGQAGMRWPRCRMHLGRCNRAWKAPTTQRLCDMGHSALFPCWHRWPETVTMASFTHNSSLSNLQPC
jgi:hypothetical protein